MHESDAQAVLLVAAFEEADAEGRLLSAPERARATEEARGHAGSDEEALVAARARALRATLEVRVPLLERVQVAGRVGAALGPMVVGFALVVGLASNVLGPRQRIHVLFSPMAGLVAWNLGVYLVLAVLAAQGARARPARGEPAPARGAAQGARRAVVRAGGLVGRAARGLLARAAGRVRARAAEDQAVVARALARYAERWGALGLPLLASRLRRLLHLGATALVCGAIAGMYVRGLGLRYGAVWESTFLDAEQVRALAGAVLLPAAWLLGREVPPLDPTPGAVGDAAPWIHLWAATGVLSVVVPRLLLAAREAVLARRLAADVRVDLGAAAFRRLLAPGGGAARSVDVVSYSTSLSPRARDVLLALLHDVFGTRADVRVGPSLAYGAEPEARAPAVAAGEDLAPPATILLFALTQPPEAEVHGRFAAGLAASRPGGRVLVLVDGSGFRERAGGAAGRLEERRRAWDRVLREAGLSATHVELDRPIPDAVVAGLASAAGPAGGPR